MTKGPITLAIRLFLIEPSDTLLQQQSARTCGSIYEHSSSGFALVNWGEAFFFKVDSLVRNKFFDIKFAKCSRIDCSPYQVLYIFFFFWLSIFYVHIHLNDISPYTLAI